MPRIATFAVPAILLGGLVLGGTLTSAAQGISGVTRRTPTLERQAAARSFFDAAGLPTAGAGVTSAGAASTGAGQAGVPLAATPTQAPGLPRPAGTPGALAPAPALATRPAPAPRAPAVARSRVNLPPVHERPFLTPPAAAGTVRSLTNRPTNPGPYHVAPSVPPRTP